MVSKRLLGGAAALLLAFCGSASAGPVLLAYYQDELAVISPPDAVPEVQFVLQLGDVPQPINPATSLGAGIWWGENDKGFVDFTAADSPAFADIASRATDGINDRFASLTVFANGNAHGTIEAESYLYGKEPDLIGYRIDLIRLLVNDVHFEPRVVEEFQDLIVYASLKYEFYGARIPEPHSLLLLTVGIGVSLFTSGLRSGGAWQRWTGNVSI